MAEEETREERGNLEISHPIHPAIVHFPVTLFPLSTVFIILWIWLDNSFYLHAAYWSFLFGALMVIPVILTGLRDLRHTRPDNRQGQKVVLAHVTLGALIGLLSTISGIFFLRNQPMFDITVMPTFITVSFLLTLMVFAQGFLGGLMVYTHRMGIRGRTT